MATDVSQVLSERQATHGSFHDHAILAQALKRTFQEGSRNWSGLSAEYREGIDMILHKLARIGTGNPYHRDHVVDIQGYAKLMEASLDETMA